MKNFIRIQFTKLLVGAYFVLMLAPLNQGQARIAMAPSQSSFLNLSTHRYDKMRLALKQGGYELFSKEAGFGSINNEDKIFLSQNLSEHSVLPELKYTQGALEVVIEGELVRIEIVDALKGKFLINGRVFLYQPEKGLAQQVKSLEKVFTKENMSFSFLNLLIPQAHAMSQTGMIVLGIVAIAALAITYFAAKKNAKTEVMAEVNPRLEAQDARIEELEEQVESTNNHSGSGDDIEVVT